MSAFMRKQHCSTQVMGGLSFWWIALADIIWNYMAVLDKKQSSYVENKWKHRIWLLYSVCNKTFPPEVLIIF